MKQAVMIKPEEIEFQEVPVPAIQDDEVLVKVMCIGVCGSDIHVYHGKHPYTSYPVVQGHEVSCEVVKTGAKVKGFNRGDRVTIEPQVSCGTCYACQNGLYNICDSLKVLGFQTTGTASDFFSVPAAKLVKLPQEMSHNEGAMIEPLAVGVRAVNQAGDIRGKKVLVYGAGPIGNLVAQTAKGKGAAKVMIVDINDFRLKKALECGIDFAVNSNEQDLEKAVTEAFGAYEKADLIFECVGANTTMESAIKIARKGTTIVVVGVFGEKACLDMAQVNENELKLLGTARYVIEDFEEAKGLIESGAVKLAPLVTDVFSFSDYNAAYQKIQKEPETTMKVLIRVNEEGVSDE